MAAHTVMIRPSYFYRAVLTPEGQRANLGCVVRPDLGGARTGRRTGAQLAGLAHLVLHPTWATHPTCYLEDLYVAKLWRDGGVARRLIEAVYAFGDGFGAARVYPVADE